MNSITSFVLGLLAFMFCAFQPAHAETRLGSAGQGSGDRGAEFRCPPGQTMVGFGARAGLWIDAVSAICAPLRPGGLIGQGIATNAYFGGSGGGKQDVYCPQGWALSETQMGVTRDDRQVAVVNMVCRNQSDGRTDNTRFIGNPEYHASCKPGPLGGLIGGIGDCPSTAPRATRCPPNELPIGFYGRVGNAVNQLGLICDIVTPPAASAAQPGLPRVIKQTGRPRVVTPHAPAAVLPPSAAPPPPAALQNTVAVKLSVELFQAPGGDGRKIGELEAGTPGVVLLAPCNDNWCHVHWSGHEGWVYSGPDYNSLGR
jgi:hypothetical protein